MSTINPHAELFALVNAMLCDHDRRAVERAIYAAHMGRVEPPITRENQHLFRRYRNTVSPDPADLLLAAVEYKALRRRADAEQRD